jgi:hypothetical protein
MSERTVWQPATAGRRAELRLRDAKLPLLVVIGFLGLLLMPSTRGVCREPAATQKPPLWPLPLPERQLTSNFMEYRAGRFHAGLDLKTRSLPGFPVLAPEDGWINRLRAAPDGYGRALYLQTASGRTYVFGHLQRFGDLLQRRVRAEQRRRGAYRVDFALPENQFAVKRGEVLALSGQSGTAGPHLHFEVRNRSQEPLNPLSQGFAPSDTIPPRILRLHALPAAPQARIEQGLTAWSIADSAGLSGLLPPLEVMGPVAFAAALLDEADAAGHHLEPYRLSVRLDGREVFALRNDRFNFAASAKMRLEWLELDGLREHWLHRRAENDLPGREGGAWSLDPAILTPGRHRVELEVADWWDNTARVAWDLLMASSGDQAGRIPASPEVRPGAVAWQEDPLGLRLPDDGDPARFLTPFLELARGQDGSWKLAPTIRAAAELPSWPLDGPQFWRLAPAKESSFLAATVLWAGPDSLDSTLRQQLQAEQGLEDMGRGAVFMAADWPAAGPLDLFLPSWPESLASDPSCGIYGQQESGAWVLAGRPEAGRRPGAGGGMVFPLPGPGRYALLRDREPPRLGDAGARLLVRTAAVCDSAGVALPRWELIQIPMRDRGAGIEPDSCRVLCDGQWLPAEPDLPRDRLLVELPDELVAGEHVLLVRVVDRAGQGTRRRWNLACSEQGAANGR